MWLETLLSAKTGVDTRTDWSDWDMEVASLIESIRRQPAKIVNGALKRVSSANHWTLRLGECITSKINIPRGLFLIISLLTAMTWENQPEEIDDISLDHNIDQLRSGDFRWPQSSSWMKSRWKPIMYHDLKDCLKSTSTPWSQLPQQSWRPKAS